VGEIVKVGVGVGVGTSGVPTLTSYSLPGALSAEGVRLKASIW
jgi:hypothetical protein